MPNTVPPSVTKEQYVLKSTFFYNKLNSLGYFELFREIQRYAQIEGASLNWEHRGDRGISDDAWNIIIESNISPVIVFAHPKVITLKPSFVKYYRSVAMIPQKGFSAVSKVSNIADIENGKIASGTLSSNKINSIIKVINEFVSLVINLSSRIDENEIQGMMYATAGTNIDGSWRNQIGAEGERVIRSIIFRELLRQGDITSVDDKELGLKAIGEMDVERYHRAIDLVRVINLKNGYSVLFSSEPDLTMFNPEGDIVGIIEIKAGLDPAGALERLGAMFKSFENTLAEYPNAVTILAISCITTEVRKRLDASMVVRQTFVTTDITSSDKEKRKFVNRLRVIMKLANSSI